METKEHQIHRGAQPAPARAPEGHGVIAGLDRRRLLELAGAIRAHEARVRGQVASPRPHDLALYRRLRQIGGSL
jgi:hypothetical protein